MYAQPLLQRRWLVACMLCLVAAPGYAQESEEEDIISTWISTEDSDAIIQFTENGLKQTYYEGEISIEYSYEFVEECEGLTALEQSPLDTVLRVVTNTGEQRCYHVMNLTDERLTLGPFRRGGFNSYEQTAQAAPDTTLFATLVQYVNENGLWIGPTDARAFDLRDVEAERLVLSMAPDAVHPVADERSQTLRRFGVPVTDIVADADCAFTSGLPVPDSTGALAPASPACQEKGSFVSVVFGSPRPADACSGTETQLDSEDTRRCVVVRAVEISDHSFYEYDLTVRYTLDQGWMVVEKTVIDGADS
ncbi:hypothetical protein CRI93_06365 [Longimonas halophila]|uniref:Uncharacterized protein n=1 Tax=Longimonas halophila TaxID=1469170 RepID=A0A2H3NTJ3_9BACT|nr:hypothetical protein [Longimonas halophila]PEN07601.1 hypothetical protein CRI93_06365 [Longimonas halophila]